MGRLHSRWARGRRRHEVTLSLRLIKRSVSNGAGRTVTLGLGSIVTYSGAAVGEIAALEDRMFRRYYDLLSLQRGVISSSKPLA